MATKNWQCHSNIPYSGTLWLPFYRSAEMQVKAAKHKLRCKEVAVNYRKRIGVSKVSGTLTGSIKAGYKILFVVFKWAFN